jgi:O-antigen/teichoic acid export membrane protein
MFSVVIGILALPWAIETFVYKAAYQESIPYLPFLATIYFFRTMRLFFTSPYGILKYTKPLPFVYLLVAGLKIVLMLTLMPFLGVYGVIAASLVSAIMEIIMLRYSIKKMFRFQYNFFKIVGAPIILFLLIIILEPLFGLRYPYTVHSVYFLSCVGLLWWAYRKEVQIVNPFQSNK